MSITLKKNSLYIKDGEEYKDISLYSSPKTIQNWLDKHPEATTTVQDNSITFNKLNTIVQNRIIDTEDNISQIQNNLNLETIARNTGENELKNQINSLKAIVGTPLIATTLEDMIDTNKIYIYVGSQNDYINGNWYYYNGTSWVSGGVYNSQAINTDKTLTVSGAAADAKTVGNLRDDFIKNNYTPSVDRGEIIYIPNGAENSPILELELDIVPEKERDEEPSSQNIISFVPRSAFSFTISNKNMLQIRDGKATVSKITATPNPEKGIVHIQGTTSSTSGGGPIIASVFLKKGVKYYASGENTYDSGSYYPRLDGPNKPDGSTNRFYPKNGIHFTVPVTGIYSWREVVSQGQSVNLDVVPYLSLDTATLNTKEKLSCYSSTIDLSELFTDFYAGRAIYDYEEEKITIMKYPHYLSYNGETLNGKWASDRDIYTPNTLPTLGAEVIDLSGTVVETKIIYSSDILYIKNQENIINPRQDFVKTCKYYSNNKNVSFIPSYYLTDSYIDTKIKDIQDTIKAANGNYEAFIYITDMHWNRNAKQSPALIKYITDRIPINTLVAGGDLGQGINMIVVNALKDNFNGDILYTIGNHEYHNYKQYPNGVAEEVTITDDLLNMYYNNNKNIVFGNKLRNYFYFDNPASKIRYIILNQYVAGATESFETEQENWLKNTALQLPNGYTAVIFAHQLAYTNHKTGAFNLQGSGITIGQIADEYSGDGQIAALIAGHRHFDGFGTTSGGIPVFVTTCDKYAPSPTYDDWLLNTREKNTITEQAFDVFVVDKTNKKVTAIRIGCPADNPTGEPLELRELNY